MTRQDFLETLRRALNGNMAAASVEDNIRFYNSYFNTEMAKGRSEQDVLAELGDARILARTLIDAADRAGDAYAREANETQYRSAEDVSSQTRGTYTRQTVREDEQHSLRIPGWLIALVVIMVLVIVVSVIGSLVWLILPYVIPVILVIYIIRLIQRR